MTTNVDMLSLVYAKEVLEQLEKYNITKSFATIDEAYKWILLLNDLEVKNLLSLNIEPKCIKFEPSILIDKNLLNKYDYIKRVEAIASIENAEGWYHLFDYLIKPEFLDSEKFYQDIETLKRAECAQTPLWIIGEPAFINSPYHDKDFELLVTAKDENDEGFDYLIWAAIANVAKCEESIKSLYHKQDLETIIKYGSKCLQMPCSYPEHSINNLAINPVSLKDKYHLENMEILANNQEIGSFLYAVMTNEKMIKKNNYRTIINEMVENKNNISYVFLVCYYAVGEDAKRAQNYLLHNYHHEIISLYDINELLKMVDEKLNVIDSDYEDVTIYEIEDKCVEVSSKRKSFINNIFKKKM